MEAKTLNNASYAWKSIIKGRDIMKQGAVWRIGLGNSIQVWRDNWLPVKNNPRIISPKLKEGGTVWISDLINPVYRTWWEEVIDQVFYDFEATIIKNIPLCRNIQKDVMI